MEIKNKKLLVIGCGKLGQKLGLLAKKTPLDLLGFKRKKITSTNIRIEQQDIFDKSFFDKVKIHSPDFILYSLSADEQSEKSYRRNYVEGLKQVIKSIKYINNFQHLFFVSSTSVYGDNNDQFIDEFSETSPKNFRGTILLEAENLLNTVKFNSTILRLSGIYGSGRNYMIKLSQDAESWPKVDRWTNRINEDDAANFIIFLLNQCLQGEIPEKLYLLTDKEPVTLFRLLNWIRQNLNLKNKINITSDPILGKRLRSSIIPSLKFEYKYPTYKQGYKELIQEAKKN
ncbi:sugar nucleotide-binding protein [Methylophilaceae bacterium]|nr:sugar nucleotide-binding protein [Methylophilaceae bacterium]